VHQLNGAKGRGINPLNYVVWSNLARALTHPAQSGPCRWKRQSRSAPLSHPAPEWSVLLYFSSTVKSTRAPRFLPCKTRSLDMSVSASTQPRPQLHLREPTQKFDVSVSVRTIQFLHPGYPNDDNTLLVSPAFDSGGVHHETARIACAILADCKWDGYFSLTRDGARLEDADADTILVAPQYYFFLEPPPAASPDSEPYPVVLSFDHFTCPGVLPPSWSTSSLTIGPSPSAPRAASALLIATKPAG